MKMTYKKSGNRKMAWRFGMLILFFSVLGGGCGGNQSNSATNNSDTLMEENMELQTESNANRADPQNENQGISESTNTPTTSPIQPQAGMNWAEAPEAEQDSSEPTMTNSETPQDSTTTNTTQ